MTEKKVAAHRAVEKKTTPALRDEADGSTFVKDYLVNLDNSAKVDEVVHERNKRDVVASALQRGLLATADVELIESKVIDQHNISLTYSVAVKLNK